MLDLSPIIQAVQLAAILCKRVQEKHLVHSEKGRDDPVTIADYGSQALICRAIRQHFPEDGVIAEEQGSQFIKLVPPDQRANVITLLSEVLGESVTEDQVRAWLDHGSNVQATRTWVIDPIDGTKGFLALRHYAIAVGIVEHGKIVGGIMGAPSYGDSGAIFVAQGNLAYRQSTNGESTPIRVSDRNQPNDLRLLQSLDESHTSEELVNRTRQLADMTDSHLDKLDSMEKYALVACGDADLYLRLVKPGAKYNHKAWDHAAGVALVQAAGGTVTDINGVPLDFSQGALLPNRGMIVSNGVIHERVLNAVKGALAEA